MDVQSFQTKTRDQRATMLFSLFALKLLIHSASAPRALHPPDNDDHNSLNNECNETVLDQDFTSIEGGLQESAHWSHLSDLITRVPDEFTLYHLIQKSASALMGSVGTDEFLDYVVKEGTVPVKWERDPPFVVIEINETMARDPFLIAAGLIHVMFEWYSCHQSLDSDIQRRFEVLEELSDLLLEIQVDPQLMHYPRLYAVLQDRFPVPSGELQMTSHYALFYYWLYYQQYIGFMSKDTLSVLGTLGEGTQAVVFKVLQIRYENNTEIENQQIPFALKIYKEHSHWGICCREERIMQRITEYNSMSYDVQIAVPALYSEIDGIPINCIQCNSMLMEFIDGTMIGSRFMYTLREAVEMYSQIKLTIDLLANIGISHNDVNEANMMIDKEGNYWVIDFGFAFSLDDYQPSQHGSDESIIGTWMWYSPDLYRLNHFVQHPMPQTNLSRHSQKTKQLIRDGNLYSLQSVILDQLVFSENGDNAHFLKKKMRSIHSAIDKIHRDGGDNRFVMMLRPLFNIWRIREEMMEDYIHRHPEYTFVEETLFSKLRVPQKHGIRLERVMSRFGRSGASCMPIGKRTIDL